ncbi:hypothetical protein CVT24_012851 [Panaeolus cyanescens]|uniref:CxC2-like cysteine cluster KDZ transposase-associated domain-containing protein n=1 Tax=Panaeolus cyanescens TaxID=181874 RepID=A0A409X0H2_9AGAR|nr:hypothetical protein CVT24_012851 [Panaeolus cyanescens]
MRGPSELPVDDDGPKRVRPKGQWNGDFFVKTSLRDLGARIQLGHKHGHPCARPEKSFNNEFWIIHTTGLHKVSLDFCGCAGSAKHYTQLLRRRLFPATVLQPQTAATFDVLDQFELLSYESKISGFEFYQAVVRLSCNDGLDNPRDRYAGWIRMVHEYCHLHMVVRAGRGHEPGGVEATKEGECAVLCPGCPQLGINMAPDWETSSKPYIHTQFLALDANFRLKRKEVSSEELDPGFDKGWSYFVENNKYRQHWSNYASEKEPKSSCSRHDAVNLSNTKGNLGHAASGVGKVCCARHNMTLPNSIGDLQVGERYCNIDYLFYKATTTMVKPVKRYIISYDIACQWSIHLQERLARLDTTYFLFDGTWISRFLVPKFHLPAHVSACRTRYSFNYTTGAGRTDGEAPERGWNETNPLAGSTREMGPGTRRDTINCHLGDHNWRKVVNMDEFLRRKLYIAALDMAEHEVEYQDVSATVPPNLLKEWIKEIDEYQTDSLVVANPFEEPDDGPTMSSIRRELAEKEAKRLAEGLDFALHDQITQSVFIDLGIKLESEQRAIKKESGDLWDHAQDRQKTKLQLNLNTLQRKIDGWLAFQRLYCPGVDRLRKQDLDAKGLKDVLACDFPLYLPSQINNRIPVDDELKADEVKLREGQAYDSLAKLRRELQTRAYLYNFTNQHTRGQGASTRAKNTIDVANNRITMVAQDYRVAFLALENLSNGEESWRGKLKPLLKEDVRHVSQAAAGESIGNQTISWIWKVQSAQPKEGDESNPQRKSTL